MNKTLRILIISALFIAAAASAQSPAPQPSNPMQAGPQNTSAFKTSFAIAFWFEACGDQPAGEMFIKALTDKVDQCPFTPEAKKEFHEWSDESRTRMAQQLEKYKAEHGGTMPERLDGMKMSCKEYQQSPHYVQMRSGLEQYVQGKMDVNSVITDRCDAQPGAL